MSPASTYLHAFFVRARRPDTRATKCSPSGWTVETESLLDSAPNSLYRNAARLTRRIGNKVWKSDEEFEDEDIGSRKLSDKQKFNFPPRYETETAELVEIFVYSTD